MFHWWAGAFWVLCSIFPQIFRDWEAQPGPVPVTPGWIRGENQQPGVLNVQSMQLLLIFWEVFHALGGFCVPGKLLHHQAGPVSPAFYKSCKRLMLQATYACVSKGKEEIHSGALAGMEQLNLLFSNFIFGNRWKMLEGMEWEGKTHLRLMTAEVFLEIIKVWAQLLQGCSRCGVR